MKLSDLNADNYDHVRVLFSSNEQHRFVLLFDDRTDSWEVLAAATKWHTDGLLSAPDTVALMCDVYDEYKA